MPASVSTQLIRKYLAGNCSPEEIARIHEWYNSFDVVSDHIPGLSSYELQALEEKLFEAITDDILKNDRQNPFAAPESSKPPDDPSGITGNAFKLFFQYKMAAVVLIIVSLGAVIYKLKVANQPVQKMVIAKTAKVLINDLPPGGNKALLTLADGSTVVLDNAANGVIIKKGNISISKAKDGKLVYAVSSTGEQEPEINTISTPVGGQYEVLLQDGTHVWLNSKSSIKFPTLFRGKERNVEISGEAYFEVAKDKTRPFIVRSDSTSIEVLGTHFDVMGYQNEAAYKTTLLEGRVKISTSHAIRILAPGEQAIVKHNLQMEVKNNFDMDQVMAWKNGYFVFKDTDIQTIMREASRWYGVNVSYKNPGLHSSYTGKISRDVNLSELLSMLKFTGLNYRLNGQDLMITD